MRTFSLIAVLLAVSASPAPLAAQPAPAGVVTTLVGQATVARAAAPAPVALNLTVGDGASLTVGLGLFGLLEFVSSVTVTGAETVAIGAGARVTTERSLISGRGTTFVAGADVDGAPFVAIGEGAQVRSGVLPFINAGPTRDDVTDEILTRSSITTTGALLSIGAGASLSTGQGLFGVVTLDATDVVAGAEVVAIEPRARVDLHQGLVSGDFLDLRNGSTLNLFTGPLLSVSGGSAVNVTGGLVNFSGTGGNRVNVANNLCPCTTLSGVPVAFENGASPANVSIGPNPIRNGTLGTFGLASPSAAAIVVSGPTSRVTIGAP